MSVLSEEQISRFRELAKIDRLLELKTKRKPSEEPLIKEAKKKSKPDCVKGNKNHDDDGRFSKKDGSSSWSGHDGGKDTSTCKAGQFRKSGNRKLITKGKGRCGRLKRTDPNIKGKYKCKDGSLNEEYTDDIEMTTHLLNDELDNFASTFQSHADFMVFLANLIDFLGSYTDAREKASFADDRVELNQTTDLDKQREKWRADNLNSVDKHAIDTKQRENPFQKRTELEQSLDEKKRRRLKRGMKGEGLTREKAMKECARFGLFSFEHFLQTLNRYESAKKAALNNKTQ